MSFPRAKIHRFNEVQSDVPSPTRYDPKMDKAKGLTVPKAEQRDRTTSHSDTLSTGGTPFRTPFSVPKKHSCVTSTAEKSITARCVNFNDITAVPTLQIDDGELNFLREDCSNKTETIVDLESIVENLTVKVADIEKEKTHLEIRIQELEAAKSSLEATAVNNKNYEKQLNELSLKIKDLEGKICALELEKADLIAKKNSAEASIAKFEEGNLEFERRILSLEGTLEQVQLDCQEKNKEVISLQDNSDKMKITIECLRGKISMLDTAKSSDEESIFALETQLSSLKNDFEAKQAKCVSLEECVSNLQLEIVQKREDWEKNEAAMRDLKEKFEKAIKKLEKTEDEKAATLLELMAQKKVSEELEDSFKRKDQDWQTCIHNTGVVIQQYEEKIFHLNDEWEKKLFSEMQEKEQCLMEKDAIMKLSDLKSKKLQADARFEWEQRLLSAEKEAADRQSTLLEEKERLRQYLDAEIAKREMTIADLSKEFDVQKEQYKEAIADLDTVVELVASKGVIITELTEKNETLISRVSNMLEEIKFLNSDNDQKQASLTDMTSKFELERTKNEKLSEQLGELDSKVIEIVKELNAKSVRNEQLLDDLKKSRHENNELKMKNIDLRVMVETQKENVCSLKSEADSNRASFNAQLLELNDELSDVKRQCRKFEIAMSDTRKSLEALGKRLLESENDVERLTVEKNALKDKLSTFEADKLVIESNYRQIMEEKIDLQQRLTAADRVEENLRRSVDELQRKNCDLELSRNEVVIFKETLEEDKKASEESLRKLQNLVNEQNIKMIEMERMTLEQVEVVSETLTSKLAAFEDVTKAKINQLNADIELLTAEKFELDQMYKAKCEEFENLFTDNDILKTTFEISQKEADLLKKHYEEQRIELDTTLLKLNYLNAEKLVIEGSLADAKKSLKDKCAELELLSDETQKLKVETEELKAKYMGLETEAQSKQSSLDKANLEISSLKQLQEEKDALIKKTEHKRDEYKSQLNEATDQMTLVLAQCENERKVVLGLEGTIREHLKAIEELTNAKQLIEGELEEMSQLKDQLEARVNAVTQEAAAGKIKAEERIRTLENEKVKLAADSEINNQWRDKWEKALLQKEKLGEELKAALERKDYYKEHCQLMEKKCAQVASSEESAVNDFYKINDLLKEREEEITGLRKVIKDLESLIEPFRDQLEQFEMERNLIENDREQLRRQHLEQAAKLGHQNNRQKIQHVVKLKKDLLELKKDNERLQVDLKTRNKTIEKLREQLGEHPKRLFIGGKRPTSTPFKGKENDSPVGIKNEPMSPSSPLRNRNQ